MDAIKHADLPPLPPSLDEVHVFMGERSDDHTRWAAPNQNYFNEDDMRAYARAAVEFAAGGVPAERLQIERRNFAESAMLGILSSLPDRAQPNASETARCAVEHADALLAELGR